MYINNYLLESNMATTANQCQQTQKMVITIYRYCGMVVAESQIAQNVGVLCSATFIAL